MRWRTAVCLGFASLSTAADNLRCLAHYKAENARNHVNVTAATPLKPVRVKTSVQREPITRSTNWKNATPADPICRLANKRLDGRNSTV